MPLVLGEILRRNAAVVPDRLALVHRHEGTRQALTYRELNEGANRVANLLASRGVGPGDRVAFVARNDVELPVAMWGAIKAGAVAVPLSFRATPDELAPHVQATRPAVVVAEDERAQALVASGLVAVDQVLAIGGARAAGNGARAAGSGARAAGSGQGARVAGSGGNGLARLAEALAGVPATEPDVAIDERQAHLMVCTSGSTGAPKRVVQSHRAYHLQTGNPVFTSRGSGEYDVGLCTYQLFHSSGWRTCLIWWRARATAVTLRRPTPAEVLDAVEAERVTQLTAVPETLRDLVASGLAEGRDLAGLHTVNTGTSALSAEDIAAFEGAFGRSRIRVHYGASEAGPVSSLHGTEVGDRPTSVGRPTPHVDVRIAGAPGQAPPLPPGGLGVPGEIVVRSDFLMDGYDGDPAATDEVLRDGWYATGDLGRLDDQGYLFVTGRVRDVIRSGGETVSPVEVEACLARHPAVVDCAVVGVADERWGEAVAAVVVVAGEVGPQELRDHVAGHLARFKVPREVVVVTEVPRSAATRKVERAKVRALIEEGS